MPAYITEWLDLTVRWVHVIAGVAWIGTSFYFNWLNSRLEPPTRAEPGVAGELWSIHGGGFYRAVKYEVAPERLPKTLHWFKWEAYATWISGFALLVLVYYLGAGFLLDADSKLSPGLAIALGIATLLVGWVVYDILCRMLGRRPVALTLIGFGLVTAAAYGLTLVLSDRAAYIHVGALLGTLMAANVFRVIIPSQQEMVEAMTAGRRPDAALGRQAALRSLHNNYLTLPVLFIMVSNHYPLAYGHAWNWAILAAIAVIGAGVRHWFNLRNQRRRNAWILPAAAVGMIALAVVTRPSPPAGSARDAEAVSFAEVRVIVAQRCAGCHSSAPTHPDHAVAPLGVMLDTPEQIRTNAARIRAVAVLSDIMPPANETGMTENERSLLGRWIEQGAAIR